MARLRFAYRCIESWPPLTWAARCVRSESVVRVFHGKGVETRPDWFCEAIWDGDFSRGGFDRTDLVFGSGGRIRDDGVTFVSAASTLDRLHSLGTSDGTWISNSLACLLTVTGARLDLGYTGYSRLHQTIKGGIERYARELPTSRSPVRMTYFRNLLWRREELLEVDKPGPERDFFSFAAYRGFLAGALAQISRNLQSGARIRPYAMLGTVSSGYDSPAVTVLGREVGLEEVVTFPVANGGQPDSGTEIGRVLGLRVHIRSRLAWRDEPLAQVPFLATDGTCMDVFMKAAEPLLGGRVLLTGHHGDAVWGMNRATASPDIVRISSTGGLSLSEYRLRAGFIHCPVPYLGVRQARDIQALTRSAELIPWRVGGSYDRPIPRRIVEEAGVPRQLFGLDKKGVSVKYRRREEFWTQASLAAYRSWLERQNGGWWRRGKLPPRLRRPLLRPFQPAAGITAKAIRRLTGSRSGALMRLRHFSDIEPLDAWVYHWAVATASERYGQKDAA